MRTARRNIYEINYWPGFVDVLGTLLIVTIFTVLISTVTQIYFNDQLEVKRGEISNLDNQISKLIIELGETKKKKDKLKNEYQVLDNKAKNLVTLKNQLEESLSKNQYNLKMKEKELSSLISERTELLDQIQTKNEKVENLSLQNKKMEIDLFEMNRNIKKLNQRLRELSSLLVDAEERDKKNKVKIENLGKKLNQALAGKLKEISEYQSIFFKKVREALGERDDIIVSGDRFIFPSEIFFSSGSDIIQENGREKLLNIASSLKEIEKKIPKKIDWILRIDGHTDKVPINNEKFSSNWHLSSSRAINIVKFLIDQGIPPRKLVAAGFGEYSPLVSEENLIAYEKNRRIEIKLTTR